MKYRYINKGYTGLIVMCFTCEKYHFVFRCFKHGTDLGILDVRLMKIEEK